MRDAPRLARPFDGHGGRRFVHQRKPRATRGAGDVVERLLIDNFDWILAVRTADLQVCGGETDIGSSTKQTFWTEPPWRVRFQRGPTLPRVQIGLAQLFVIVGADLVVE